MAIGISAGTTTHTLAARVADIPGVTVVTNSLRVAEVLYRSGRRDQTVILTGGVRTPSEALVGSFAVAQLRSVHLDLVFMGVHGMDGKAGFTCPNLSEADTDRALIEAGRRLVVLADHTKWGVIGIASIARLDQADVLVSDTLLDAAAQSTLREVVGEVVLVDAGEPADGEHPVGLDDADERLQAAGRAH
jgi:DeoR/GlpR family transcriptional regulator of sugar metabolism